MKKANLAFNWVEYLFMALLVLGFILALKVSTAAMSYIVIFLIGLISGRFVYKLRKNMTFPLYVVLIGFLLGYLLGSFYGSKKIIFVMFIIGNTIIYYIYDKGYLK